MTKNNCTNMFKDCKEILEIRDIFAMNLDDYSDVDNFEYSKGMLWGFRNYLCRNSENAENLLGLDRTRILSLCDKKLDDNTLTDVINEIDKHI